MAKRATGVPNYYYLNKEFPENYDTRNLKIYDYSRWDRIVIWLYVVIRQFLLRFFLIRWFFNIVTYITEFFIRYFPILSFCKFGCGNAYVDIRQ